MLLVQLLLITAIDLAAFNVLNEGPSHLAQRSANLFLITVVLTWMITTLLRVMGKEEKVSIFLKTFHTFCVLSLAATALCSWAQPARLICWGLFGANLGMWWGHGIRQFFKPKLAD